MLPWLAGLNEEVNVEAKTVQIHACAFKEKKKKKE